MHSFVRIKKTTATELIDRVRDFYSYYAMASYFIGKGQRGYDKRNNRFSSVSIDGNNRNVWELALRYSRIHLRESVDEIKKMSDVTLGINWYYSETWRVMFNYIHSRIQNRYSANAFQMRLQATF
jgi:phosphate-selective porin